MKKKNDISMFGWLLGRYFGLLGGRYFGGRCFRRRNIERKMCTSNVCLCFGRRQFISQHHVRIYQVSDVKLILNILCQQVRHIYIYIYIIINVHFSYLQGRLYMDICFQVTQFFYILSFNPRSKMSSLTTSIQIFGNLLLFLRLTLTCQSKIY